MGIMILLIACIAGECFLVLAFVQFTREKIRLRRQAAAATELETIEVLGECAELPMRKEQRYAVAGQRRLDTRKEARPQVIDTVPKTAHISNWGNSPCLM